MFLLCSFFNTKYEQLTVQSTLFIILPLLVQLFGTRANPQPFVLCTYLVSQTTVAVEEFRNLLFSAPIFIFHPLGFGLVVELGTGVSSSLEYNEGLWTDGKGIITLLVVVVLALFRLYWGWGWVLNLCVVVCDMMEGGREGRKVCVVWKMFSGWWNVSWFI